MALEHDVLHALALVRVRVRVRDRDRDRVRVRVRRPQKRWCLGGKESVRRRDGAGELRAGGLWAGWLVAACLQMVRAAQPRLAAAHHDRRQLLEARGRLVGAPPPRPPRHALDAVVRHPAHLEHDVGPLQHRRDQRLCDRTVVVVDHRAKAAVLRVHVDF